jgi:urea transport system substrate-binding protein
MVEKAQSFDVAAVQEAAGGVSFDAPEGSVTVDGDNHHIAKTALIGRVNPEGLIDTVWSSDAPIEPDPCLEDYPWAASIEKDQTYCG